MAKRKPNYLKCVVIVHGKSEKQICEYIKNKLRLNMEIISKDSGNNSIQINGLHDYFFRDRRLSSFSNFSKYYSNIEMVGKKKHLASYFKIFAIMDTDDCSTTQRNRYINREMFKGHWAYDYIMPIYNSPDLEHVIVKSGIKFEKKGIERKKEYVRIFPTDSKYQHNESVELNTFAKNLANVSDTNMNLFVEFCIENS